MSSFSLYKLIQTLLGQEWGRLARSRGGRPPLAFRAFLERPARPGEEKAVPTTRLLLSPRPSKADWGQPPPLGLAKSISPVGLAHKKKGGTWPQSPWAATGVSGPGECTAEPQAGEREGGLSRKAHPQLLLGGQGNESREDSHSVSYPRAGQQRRTACPGVPWEEAGRLAESFNVPGLPFTWKGVGRCEVPPRGEGLRIRPW